MGEAVASAGARVHIGLMITTVGRGSPEPSPRPTLAGSVLQGSGAPQFAVQFSRPRSAAGRADSRYGYQRWNSFRWTGPGTIHILERGMLVMTRRRSPLGFRTADERFVAAAEICEVFREGDSIRVDLRGEDKTGEFFQFWTGNPAIAGTIVRLLPTTRTIEYDGATADQMPLARPPLSLHRRRRARQRWVSAALIVGLVAVGALLITDIVVRHAAPGAPAAKAGTGVGPGIGVVGPETGAKPLLAPAPPVPHATSAEITNALSELRRFDDRIDGLRAQYRTASIALQWGQLSQDEFVDGLNKWLIPQWRALYSELASSPHEDGSLTSLVRKRLIGTAIGWNQGLEEYAEGLRTNSYDAVIAAFDRMSRGNEARREAWRMVERAEFDFDSTSSSRRTP